MLNNVFSTLRSVAGASVKGAISDYTPTASNMGGAFTRIAQQGIANLSYRSPILADIASTMLHSFQSELIHRDKVKSHVSSDDSNALRAAVSEKLGPDASKEKVDSAMSKVIDKMSKIVDAEGMEAAKKSEVFKEFGEYFKNFKKPQEQPQTTQSGDSSGAEGTLGRIDVNTSKTAQLLAEMVSEGITPGTQQSTHPVSSTPNVPGPTPNPGSFIDPMTGLPSIKAAVGSIGGTFLAKVFDDSVITKYANKTRSKLFGVDDEAEAEDIVKKPEVVNSKPEPSITVKKVDSSKERQTGNIQEILKGISLDLSKPSLPESFAPMVSGATQSVENFNESVSKDTKRAESSNSLLEQIIEQLKKLNDKKANPVADDGSGLGLDDVLKSKSKLLGNLGNVAKGAGRLLGPAALVASAGAAGYGLGTMLNPLIDKGITAASGEENSLGTWIYNKTHPEESLDATKSEPQIIAAKSKQIQEIEKMQATKDATSKQQTASTPVVLNTPVVTNNNSTTVIATASVRNQESTFERVQFQDFWRRVA